MTDEKKDNGSQEASQCMCEDCKEINKREGWWSGVAGTMDAILEENDDDLLRCMSRILKGVEEGNEHGYVEARGELKKLADYVTMWAQKTNDQRVKDEAKKRMGPLMDAIGMPTGLRSMLGIPPEKVGDDEDIH